MNAVIQTAGYENTRAALTVAGGVMAAGTGTAGAGHCKMYQLAGGLQAWLPGGDTANTAIWQQLGHTGEGFVLYIHNDGGPGSRPLLRLWFCQPGTTGRLPASNGADAQRIIIYVSRNWLDSFFNSGFTTMVLIQQLGELPGGAYHQPLPADWEFLAMQVLEGGGNALFTMNRLLLLFEKFVNRLSGLLSSPAGIAVFPDSELARLQLTEQELRNALCGPAPTIGQLARKAAMSPTKLKKIFREVYGAPIYRYYQHMRLRQARVLLETGSYTVKEAGLKIGYTNLSHFSGAFKKEFGLLPSQLVGGTGLREFAYKVLE